MYIRPLNIDIMNVKTSINWRRTLHSHVWSIVGGFKVSWVKLASGQGHDLGFVCLLGAHTLSIA